MLRPSPLELPSLYADRLGMEYSTIVSLVHKKKLGQFFTPHGVATFIASNVSIESVRKIKILDPGCGIGILSCALIEKIIINNLKIKEIELLAFETDIELIPYAEECLNYLRVWLKNKKIDFKHIIAKNDFILSNSKILTNQQEDENDLFDVVITNPPYFKINKEDPRAIEAKPIIHGQTNIYSIFLMLSASLLKTNGKLAFITPRSFASGTYFSLFRERFFQAISIDFIHLFGSRKDAFKRDKVLQESIIICGTKKNRNEVIPTSNSVTIVSTSNGMADQLSSIERQYKSDELIDFSSKNKILYIPVSNFEDEVIKVFKSWKNNLTSLGYDVSTGPVVAYRSKGDISSEKNGRTVPFIWIHNISKMNLSWPINRAEKGQYIKLNKHTLSKLLPNRNYVFVKRFSTKDDESRLIAMPYFSERFSHVSYIGLENHLNYIYRFLDNLDEVESFGIAGLLNSKLFDTYFRTFNGNTNVSVSDLKNIPFPDKEIIISLGKILKNQNIKNVNQKFIDKHVNLLLNLKISNHE